MPRRRRTTYSEYLEGLLRVSRSTGRKRKFRSVPKRPPIHAVRQEEAYDPVLYRQLVTAERRAEVAEDKAIVGHKFKLAEQEQAHRFKLQEGIVREGQNIRRDLLKQKIDEDETAADIESKSALTRLRDAQTDEIISKPAIDQWKAMIQTLQENQKQQGRMKLDVQKHEQAIDLEDFRHQNRKRLERLKQAIKPKKIPKETTFQIFERLRNTGEISTVGDVAKFWFGKGKKREDVNTLLKMEMRAAGIPFEQVFEEEGGFIESKKDIQRAWQRLFTVPLSQPPVSQEASNLTRQFPSRAAAERFLRDNVRNLQAAGLTEEEMKTVRADELNWLGMIEKQFPQQPSVYHQLIAEPVLLSDKPSRSEVFSRMKQDLKGLFSRASAGLKMTDQDESELTKQLQDFVERSRQEQFGLPKGRASLQDLGVQ